MIKLPCADGTIARRLKLLNVLTFALLLVLAVSNCGQFLALEKQLVNLRQFHELVEEVLELRSHGHDLLRSGGAGDMAAIRRSLARITGAGQKLQPVLARLSSPEEYQGFVEATRQYRACLAPPEQGTISRECLQRYGNIMVGFVTAVRDRGRVGLADSSLRTIFFTFTLVPMILAILLTGLILSQAGRVLNRITLAGRAGRMLRENPAPIPDTPSARDEVHSLIQGANRMATELEARTNQLIQVQKLAAIGTFSSSIAHELNNPLNNISLSADMLLQDLDQLSPDEIREILSDILSQTDRAGAIVRDLLHFSRAGETPAREIDVRDLVGQALGLIANQLRLGHVRVDTSIPDDLPAIRGDLRKLQQVLLNLLTNAIQAMPGGGRIRINARHDGDTVRIDVSDTGEGIPPEKISRIFDPFFTTREAGQGTGLGLAISREIVRRHGGRIEVKSRPGQGTTFSVLLPAVAARSREGRTHGGSGSPSSAGRAGHPAAAPSHKQPKTLPENDSHEREETPQHPDT